MEGDNKQRRKAAREAREAGARPSEFGATTGASKQPARGDHDGDHLEKLARTQRGEVKQAGKDVPRPLRGKGRGKDPLTPPRPE